MSDLVKHGELSVQQITDIQKSILVSLRSRKSFWDKFCSHDAVNDGYSALEWRKLNVPKLTPDQIANLTEGHTPDSLGLEYVKFTVTPVDFGNWIGYTDKSKKYNYDDVVRDAKVRLGQDAFDQSEIRKAQQYISGCCTMDLTASGDNKFLKDLLKARTILKKNNVKPLSNGKYGCILTSEHAAEVLITYQNAITHTSQKEALIDGYLGELGGFILFECTDKVMYKPAVTAVTGVYKFKVGGTVANGKKVTIDGVEITMGANDDTAAECATALANGTYTNYTITASGDVITVTEKSGKEGTGKPTITNDGAITFTYQADDSTTGVAAANLKGYCLFIGKTEYGLPVQTVAFGNASVQTYDNGLGSVPEKDPVTNAVKPDALHQRGSVGYKVMGFATRILFDEAVIRAEYDFGSNTEVELTVTDANRTGYTAKSASPSA